MLNLPLPIPTHPHRASFVDKKFRYRANHSYNPCRGFTMKLKYRNFQAELARCANKWENESLIPILKSQQTGNYWPQDNWTRSYKEIFSVNLHYHEIQALLFAD